MRKKISKFQVITPDFTSAREYDYPLISRLCAAGVDWIQFRSKLLSQADLIAVGNKLRKITKESSVKLIVNDYVNVARSIGADGVHLGKSDLSIKEAREVLGNHAIIGATINSVQDLKLFKDFDLVDYFGVGPFAFTRTKSNLSRPLGVEGTREIVSMLSRISPEIPVVAVGGISDCNLKLVLESEVYGIALCSGVFAKEEPIGAAAEVRSQIYG